MQSPQLRSVLEDIFIVRRIQTVAEVFSLCAQLACAFRSAPAAPAAPLAASPAVAMMLDDAALCKPVRRYVLFLQLDY